jgi:hypothetical protein
MNIGVFHMEDGAASWTDYSDNLPKVAINELEIQQASGMIRVATYGRGVWESPLAAAAGGFNFNTPAPALSACPAPASMSISLQTISVLGFSNPVTLSATGAPAGTTVSFSVNPVTPGGTTIVSLNNTSSLAAGTYVITVNGTASGAASQSRDLTFTINAGSGPVITAQPASQNVCEGQGTSFTVGTSGAQTFQWQVSTDNCATWNNVTAGALYSGVSSATLTLQSSTSVMNGYAYRVIVGGQCGSSTSSPCAVLSVSAGPAITAQPAGTAICTGGNASLCVTASGSGLSYQWEMSPSCNGPWTNVPGATASCLNAAPSADTYYRVRISSGGCGSTISNCALVTVHAPATITLNPQPAAACEGANVSFTAAGTGVGLGYQWQVSTDNGNSYNNIAGANSATLNLNNVTAAMNGYRYRALLQSTQCAPQPSQSALLTVHALPSVSLTTSIGAILPGQQATLTAVINGSGGNISTNWFYNNGPLNNPGNTLAVDIQQLGQYHLQVQESWADGSVCSAQSAPVEISAAASSRLFIFPSPNDGRFNVSYYNSSGATAARTVTVYDAKGATVYQERFNIAGPYTLLDIDITPAQRGVYLVMISDASGSKIAEGKVTVQ